MHVQAIRAAVDLRRAHFHQLQQLPVQTALMNVFLQGEHCPQRLLSEFIVVIDAHFHSSFSFISYFHRACSYCL